jgi:hypothetical protein
MPGPQEQQVEQPVKESAQEGRPVEHHAQPAFHRIVLHRSVLQQPVDLLGTVKESSRWKTSSGITRICLPTARPSYPAQIGATGRAGD